LAAACSSEPSSAGPEETTSTTDAPTPSSSVESTTTSEGPIVLTASFRGVTEGVIRVGVLSADFDRLSPLGISFGNTNVDGVYTAPLEAINDRGGVFGRKLEITSIVWLGAAEEDAACVALTDDVEVFVVLGDPESNLACYTELNETAVIARTGMTDGLVEAAKAPFAVVQMAEDRMAVQFVDSLADAGLLDDQVVGVVGSVDVDETRYRRVVDALRQIGIAPVEALIGNNAADLAANIREAEVLAEFLGAEGVTFLVNAVGVASSLGIAADIDAATALFPSINSRAMRDDGIDLAVVDDAYSVTETDVSTLDRPGMADDPAVAACIDDAEARTGEEISYALDAEVTNLYWALNGCAMAIILEQALLNAGPELTYDSLQAGLEAIGDIDLPGYTDSRLGPGDLAAGGHLTLIRFDATLGAWVEVP
jgi:hypothetical protein